MSDFSTHPVDFQDKLYRGYCTKVHTPGIIEVFLDLGFGLYASQVLQLFNLSVPSISSQVLSEQHAARAAYERVRQLVHDKPVMVASYLREEDGLLYRASVFFPLQGTISGLTWNSLEKQLVQEQHAAWIDPNLEEPFLD